MHSLIWLRRICAAEPGYGFQGLEALTGYTVSLFGVLTLQQCKTLKKEGRGFRSIGQTFLALCTITRGTVLSRTCTQSSEVVSYHVFPEGRGVLPYKRLMGMFRWMG